MEFFSYISIMTDCRHRRRRHRRRRHRRRRRRLNNDNYFKQKIFHLKAFVR